VIAVTVLSLSISPLWLTTARRVHGLASRQIGSLRELVDAAYGDEVQVVRRGSRRFAIVTRIVARQAWNKAATRFPRLARIRKPHRPAPAGTKQLTGPETAPGTPPDAAPSSAPGKAPDTAEKAPPRDTLTRLGDQVREAAEGDQVRDAAKDDAPPAPDKPKDA
jgi:hypothetical protein